MVEVETAEPAEQDWTAHVQDRARETLYMTANSFFNGGEVAGEPRVFIPYSGGIRAYRRLLEEEAAAGYAGFALRRTPRAADAATEASHG